MSKFKVSQEKEQQLLLRMTKLGISEKDIVERFIRGSGSGGQKINKTSSCVHIIHRPSGIEVKCQADRSQSLNRFLARRELCDKLEAVLHGKLSSEQQAIEKIRRQKRRRNRKAKAKMLADKAHRGELKRSRSNLGSL